MNNYDQDLHFDVILPRLRLTTRKQILATLAAQAGKYLNISKDRAVQLLLNKENKSSSGMEGGVAIPHLQVRGPQKHFTILATLEHAVDFEAADNQPADLVCLVLSPESDGPLHLRRLSRISRLLMNETLHKKLCEARDEQSIRALLIDPEGWLMAA
ncbi:MAG: PTS sugar transporter subunit IIA [Alphaproteobacteria bacterium]